MKLTSSRRASSAARSRSRASARVRRVSWRSRRTAESSSGTGAAGTGSAERGAVEFGWAGVVVSATSCCRPAPSCAEPLATRRITSQVPTSASSTAVTSATRTTVESWPDKNISRTLISTVAATAATGSSVAIINW